MTNANNRRGSKTLSCLLAAVFAFAMAHTAWAAYYAWSGGGSAPFYFDDTANWGFRSSGTGDWRTVPEIGSRSENLNIDPTLLVDDNIDSVSYDAGWNKSFPSAWDNTIKFRTTTSLIAPIILAYADAPVVFSATSSESGVNSTREFDIKSGANLQIESGTYSFSGASPVSGTLSVSNATLKHTSNYMRVGNAGDGTVTIGPGGVYENFGSLGSMTVSHTAGYSGTLNIAGGSVSLSGSLYLCYNASSVSAAVNVTDGGVLTLKKLVQSNAGTSGGTLTLDGGTLRAYANENEFLNAHGSLNVYVGANGATFDSNGHDIAIGADIQDKSGEAGVVTFTGGGVITLNGTPSYTGGTTNVAGTVLSLTAAAKAALFANPIVVEIPPAGVIDGRAVFEVNDGNGTFTQAEVDAIAVTGTDASRYALVLAEGGAKIVVTDTFAGEYVWNGGSSGAGWHTQGKWTKNGIAGDWHDSTAAVFENAGDEATVYSDISAASVTFRANATIATGGGTLTPGTVAVSNGVSAVINAPTAGVLEKTGEGTLTLSQSRTAQTDITEGTLVMSGGGVTIPWDSVKLGTVAGNTSVLKFENGATLSSISRDLSLGNNGSISGGVTVELHKEDGEWNVPSRLTAGWNNGDVGKFYHNGGTMTVGEQFRVSSQAGSSGEFTMNGGTMTVSKNLYVGCNDNAVKGVFNMNGGSFTCNGTTYVAFAKNDYPAELHINGGTFTSAGTFVAGNGANTEAVIELNSTNGIPGVLETTGLTLGRGSATLTFNGGELKAVGDLESADLIQSGIAVHVGANGGIINANGKAVTIGEELSGEGGMTYKGGGTVMLSVSPTYTGKTTIELGTALVIPAAIAGADLEVVIPEGLATGAYKIAGVSVSGGGEFASDILSTATLPSGVTTHFFLDNGNRDLWCIYSPGDDHIWVGGATGSLNDGANWLSGNVPTNGTAIIGSISVMTLTNPEGSSFAATTIVVPNDSAHVMISGALFNLSRITNNSSNAIEFEDAVEFSGEIDVVQNTGAVKFIGGVTGTKLARATDIHGTYNFTATGDLTEIDGTTVKSDGVYNLPNATFYKHNGDFSVEAGGKAEVGAARINRSTESAYLLDDLSGEFKVDGEFLVSASSASGTLTHYVGHRSNGGDGTLIANKIRVNQHACIVPLGKTVIGGGGVIRGNGYVRVYNSGSHEFGSYDDWTMYHDSLGNTETTAFVFYKHNNSSAWSYLTFDTTDYYDNTIGRTITCEAPIGAADAASAAKFGVTVKGIGKFVFANTSDGDIFSGGLTVTDSATVEVKPNSWPGKGAVTLNGTSTLLMHTNSIARTSAIVVNGGATLEVAESGTVALGGDLRLNDGATLKFNFTERGNPPVLDLADKEVTFGEHKEVKVSLAGTRRPIYGSDGRYILTSGCDFTGANVSLVSENQPKWAKCAGVDEETGNIFVEISSVGFYMSIQ